MVMLQELYRIILPAVLSNHKGQYMATTGVLLQIVRGDRGTLTATLSRTSTWSLADSTVKMSFVFDDDVVHTFTGAITDYDNYVIDFVPTEDSVASVRCGEFDVAVIDDNTSISVTHITGTVDIIADVTP